MRVAALRVTAHGAQLFEPSADMTGFPIASPEQVLLKHRVKQALFFAPGHSIAL